MTACPENKDISPLQNIGNSLPVHIDGSYHNTLIFTNSAVRTSKLSCHKHVHKLSIKYFLNVKNIKHGNYANL
jgi:hypothetical protein